MIKMFVWVGELLYNIFMEQIFIQNSEIFLKLVVAVLLGLIIGAERLLVKEAAGMKTHALVSLGAAVFVIISEMISMKYGDFISFDPSRIASQVIVGIGFLGAGSIILQGSRLIGLTTAGGLWVTAGIGMATGFGFYSLAIISTFLVLFILVIINIFEKPIIKISGEDIGNKKV